MESNYERLLCAQTARYLKIMKLSDTERAPYAAGISKLEAQIDQLREATGLTADAFVRNAHAILGVLPEDTLTDAAMDDLGALLDEAGKCYNIGDKSGTNAAFIRMKNYAGRLLDAKANRVG